LTADVIGPPDAAGPDADMATLARGGRLNVFGFVLRLIARLPFLFIAGHYYGAAALGRFAYAVLTVEFAAQLAAFGLRRGLAQQLADATKPHVCVIADAMLVAAIGSAIGMTILGFFPQAMFPNSPVYGLDWLLPVTVFAITGSSGAGVTPTPTTHHPRRASAFFAYSIDGHRHLPEIEESLSAVGAPAAGRIVFQTHSAPLVRGIFATAAVPLKAPMDKAALREVYRAAYEHEFFIRMMDGSPDVAAVKGTNFADIGVASSGDGSVAKVFVAIDNLVKGAAGQAIQAMNILFDLPEPTGLKMTGVFP
jgi:hypothetical protein